MEKALQFSIGARRTFKSFCYNTGETRYQYKHTSCSSFEVELCVIVQRRRFGMPNTMKVPILFFLLHELSLYSASPYPVQRRLSVQKIGGYQPISHVLDLVRMEYHESLDERTLLSKDVLPFF